MMKSSKGFTFLEVIVAVGIMAIIMPVVAIVFYNVLVIPPEQGDRLTLNNEVALLASYLYKDAHMADNFSEGVYPYYGNFSWTDYTTGDEYLIIYRGTCPNQSDPSCDNRIVREMITTYYGNLSAPTPTPTGTATATPTATPTSTPSTVTYTYASGGGDNKWAWAKAWNSSEWAAIDSIDPDEFLDTSNRSLLAGGSSAYSLLSSALNNSWSNPDDDPVSWDYVANSQLYVFQLSQNRSLVNNISVTWRGYGGDLTYNTKLRIWNNTSGSWYTIPTMSFTDPGSKVINTYIHNLTSSPTDYIKAGTDLVSLQVSSDINGETARDIDFGDALTFNGSNSSMITTNSTVPTNTFTFEAWVKCTETHEIDTELANYGGVNNQHYVFGAAHRSSNAGAGVSVGTNGITVYEHGDSYMPSLVVYEGNLGTAWNHIAIVYNSKTPSIYLNGNLVRTVSTATIDALYAANRGTVYAPYQIGGGSYGYFNGIIDEVRVWNIALNQTQIRDNMYIEDPSLSGTSTYTVVYNSSGSFTPPAGVTSVKVLVVGGGGGGGGAYTGANYFHGGGGGAGGVVYNSSYFVTPSVPITVTVGAGGAGGMGYNNGSTYAGINGSNSVFGSITAYGGGGGGGGHATNASIAYGKNGGSGGGSGSYCNGANCCADYYSNGQGGNGTTGQGYGGGKAYYECCCGLWCTCPARTGAGGGGGADEVGADAIIYVSGNGGNGSDYSTIFNSSVGDGGWFGGGGGGGHISTRTPGSGGQGGGGDGGLDTNGSDASANTGGGGGGAGSSDGDTTQGGDGGSGVVIVKYSITSTALVGYLKFNDCASDVGDGKVEDSSTFNNDGTLSSPAPQCADGVTRDLTPYTDYVALTVTTTVSATPTPTVPPAPAPTTVTFANTTVGTSSWTVPAGVSSVTVLVVGGGGGGGGSSILYYCGAGGGAGGVIYNSSYPVTPGSISITVGGGGARGDSGNNRQGQRGGNSAFGTLTAIGGGGGGGGYATVSGTYADGTTGGSGGGGASQTSGIGDGASGTSGQGNSGSNGFKNGAAGDNAAGGGGGAFAAAGAAAKDDAGDGGAGYYSATFSTYGAGGYFGGGGGGGAYSGANGPGGTGGGGAGGDNNGGSGGVSGGSATANTGGGAGGGAAGWWTGTTYGGTGGSGIVIVRYTISYKTLNTSAGTGGSVTPAPPGANYYTGTPVNITATSDECYSFVNWTGDTGTIADPNDPTTTITMNGNYSIQANFTFSSDTLSLALTADPAEGGSPYFEGSSPFTCGTSVPIYADANPGYSFTEWTGTGVGGVANANASDTTVLMIADCELEANYTSGPTVTPTPTPVISESTLYVAWHIAANNFSLTQSSNFIVANMTSTMNTNKGEYVEKQLTIYIQPRPIYLLPELDIWGEDTFSSIDSLRFEGRYNSISGNVKVNGTVTVTSSAYKNVIDGTLTCPTLTWPSPGTENLSKLDYTSRITQYPNNVMPNIGTPDDIISTNLSTGTTDWDEADRLHEYVFTGDVNFTLTGSDARVHCWLDWTNHELKPGTYYSPGTITLATTWDGPTSGEVTFIANRIIISNGQDWGWTTDPTIRLGPYYNEILFWANGSSGQPATDYDGDILIRETSGNPSDWHACASLEGVLFAPNGEIELAGSGAEGWFGYIMPAELYSGAMVAKHLTISGNHWNFYRW